MEAESILERLPNTPETEDAYYQCLCVILGDPEAARKHLKKRVKAQREAEAREFAEREEQQRVAANIRGRRR